MQKDQITTQETYSPPVKISIAGVGEVLHFDRNEASILKTPIGQALKEHFAQYGDIFKERVEL